MLYPHLKRTFDIALVVIILGFGSWIIVLIFIGYLLSFKLPVFYQQKRIGKNNVSFTLWKFRTLSTDESLPSHQRTFALGSFLRLTSLDELPQLWNIVKGEMSFVGPRPLPVEYLPLYSDAQKRRHNVRPGITGWAQVNGRHSISWKKKFELDLYYVDNVSFKLDLLVLVKTVALLLSFVKDTSLSEKKFDGSN